MLRNQVMLRRVPWSLCCSMAYEGSRNKMPLERGRAWIVAHFGDIKESAGVLARGCGVWLTQGTARNQTARLGAK